MRTAYMRRFALVAAMIFPLGIVIAAAPKPSHEAGERMLDAYFRGQVAAIERESLTNLSTKADWEKRRPELRRQLLEMMGLWPLPPRTDLKAIVTGTVDADTFRVEKLHFQSSPGLYVTANLYVPKKAATPAPAILYVCGHSNTVIDKVSYGSKVSFQGHAAWYAANGYVCLVLDTLQLGELPGLHHGTHHLNLWDWQTLGYTPAGIECWNAMRALDYLETRKEVDPKRIGVTGRSGGGATSWWLMAADDRPHCAVPVAGIADLSAHCCEGVATRFRQGVIGGHCDCMYFVNTYRWDFPTVAALCAPRPLLVANSDNDVIFPQPGVRRVVEKTRAVYDLYGAKDKFAFLETTGGHVDTPQLRHGAYAWMNRWLKHDAAEVTEVKPPPFTPQQLKVLARAPDDAVNAAIHESFIRPARTEMPRVPEVAREWWKGKSAEWKQTLADKVFPGWPAKAPPLNVKPVAEVVSDGLRLRAFDFTSEANVDLRVWLLTADKVDKPTLVVLHALDEKGFEELARDMGPTFKDSLQLTAEAKRDDAKFDLNRRVLEKQKWGFAYLAPRGIGPTRWDEPDTHIRRRFALLGQTLDGQRVWDTRRALAVLRETPDLKEVPLWLQGKGTMAGVALYAAIFEPDVARLDLWHPPASHAEGPIFLNVRRHLDMPQAMALAFPRQIRVYVKDDAEAKRWEWPLELQRSLGHEALKIRKVPD